MVCIVAGAIVSFIPEGAAIGVPLMTTGKYVAFGGMLADNAIDLDAKTADKVMNKYIDLFNKYARIDGDYTDARRLTRLIERNHDKMSEETVIKFIESLKQFSFERAQTWSIRKYIVENEFTKRSPEELKRIDVKLKELEEIVKDMPMKNKLKPNG